VYVGLLLLLYPGILISDATLTEEALNYTYPQKGATASTEEALCTTIHQQKTLYVQKGRNRSLLHKFLMPSPEEGSKMKHYSYQKIYQKVLIQI
jgi:hypothetical protein